MAIKSNKEKKMADKGDKSQSTDFVPFDRVNKGGITPSMPAGGQSMTTKGSEAHFAHGKKTVSK
jgi:hypothetical protein